MTDHTELSRVTTKARKTAHNRPLLLPRISSASFSALAKQGMKKMRILALHT